MAKKSMPSKTTRIETDGLEKPEEPILFQEDTSEKGNDKKHDEILKKESVKKAKNKSNQKNKFKDEPEIYILKKIRLMKILRFIFWTMVIIIFIKGVIVSIRPDPTVEVYKTIANFKNDFSSYKDQYNEVLSFAQNFAQEFLTYEANGETDYTNRLKPYVSPNVLKSGFKFTGGSRVLYIQAYRKDAYSQNQADVYVLAKSEYTNNDLDSNKIIEETILKIPIQIKDNHYIVEDLPAFVNDDIKINNYTPSDFSAHELSKEETQEIKQALTNFYKAYYEEEQSVINYYLTKDADKNLFIGLNKRVLFDKVSAIKCCKIEGNNDITALVTVDIIDKNGVEIPQKFNLQIVLKDNQYYIQSMNTRTVNLNILSEVKIDENTEN